jgi:predicted nucleic acid-binding protein
MGPEYRQDHIVMAEGFLVDTDILIDYLRDRQEAVEWLESSTGPLYFSAISIAENYSGMRDHERPQIETLLTAFTIIPVDPVLAERGGLLRREYFKSHGTGLADAIIAATVQAIGCTLVSLNHKHYPMLDPVLVPYRKD